jgi:hypothetical protein
MRVWSREQLLDDCRLSQSGFCPSNRKVCDPSHLEVSLSTAAPVRGVETTATSLSLETLKVNVEWWTQPSASVRPQGTGLVTQTRALPSLE